MHGTLGNFLLVKLLLLVSIHFARHQVTILKEEGGPVDPPLDPPLNTKDTPDMSVSYLYLHTKDTPDLSVSYLPPYKGHS